MNDETPTLPGLDFDLHNPGEHPLRAAVLRTLRALDDEGLLKPQHAAYAQLALELADSIARSRGRASAAAMAGAQLMAALEALPSPTSMSAEDALQAWLAADIDEPAA